MKKFFKKIFNFTKKYLTIVIIAFLFIFLFICNNTSFKLGNELMDNLKSIATSFTPTTDLFDDGSEVSFVSYFFGMKAKVNKVKETTYYYPVISQNLSTDNNYLLFNNSGIVYSMAEGKVKNVGFNNSNEKYVEIEQIDGRISKFEGLETVGVAIGDYILANKPIGLSTVKSYLKVQILENNNTINISEIEWAN